MDITPLEHFSIYGLISLTFLSNIFWFDRGRLEKIVNNAGHVVGKPLDSFKILNEKLLYKNKTKNNNNANIK